MVKYCLQNTILIDFFVSTRWAMLLLYRTCLETAPWKPHEAVMASLAARPGAVLAKKICKPKFIMSRAALQGQPQMQVQVGFDSELGRQWWHMLHHTVGNAWA